MSDKNYKFVLLDADEAGNPADTIGQFNTLAQAEDAAKEYVERPDYELVFVAKLLCTYEIKSTKVKTVISK